MKLNQKFISIFALIVFFALPVLPQVWANTAPEVVDPSQKTGEVAPGSEPPSPQPPPAPGSQLSPTTPFLMPPPISGEANPREWAAYVEHARDYYTPPKKESPTTPSVPPSDLDNYISGIVGDRPPDSCYEKVCHYDDPNSNPPRVMLTVERGEEETIALNYMDGSITRYNPDGSRKD